MAWKYYAVRKGKRRGVVTSWDECKQMIEGVSCAEFKGFNSEPEANAYLLGEAPAGFKVTRPDTSDTVNVYARGKCVDGHIDIGIAIESQHKIHEFYGRVVLQGVGSSQGFAGELIATMIAAQICHDMGFVFINVISAYEGIEKWVNKTWSANGYLQSELIRCLSWLEANACMRFQFNRAPKGWKCRCLSDAEHLVKRSGDDIKYINPDKTMKCQLLAKDVPLYSIS